MSIDASSDDLDALRELVAQLSSERDAALEECRSDSDFEKASMVRRILADIFCVGRVPEIFGNVPRGQP